MAVAARGALFVGALAVIGEVGASWVHGARWGERLAPASRTTVLASWWVASVALLMLFVAQFLALELAPSAADVAMLVRQTAWGTGWMLLTACVLVGAFMAFIRAALVVRLAAVVALAVAMGGLGHAAADETAPWLARALDAGHVVAVGAWLGTLAQVARTRSADAWSRFSRLATVAAPIAIATGGWAAWRRVSTASVPLILASDYGRLLALKTAIVVGVLLLGAWHRRQLRARGLPSSAGIRAEIALACATLLVTAVLTGSAPPGE